MVRTRFAPSPTGSLHVGNARIAVLNWLFARHHDGVFVLRFEDTDLERQVAGAEQAMLEDLAWLGLQPDEGPTITAPQGDGPYGPYRQSNRRELYRSYARQLLESGAAFQCFCTDQELIQKREEALKAGRQLHYDGTCRQLDGARSAHLTQTGRVPALRFRVPDRGVIEVNDLVRGTIRFDAADIGDFILLRSDGLPTYNFAVVVDDALMKISHVIRGIGHLSNTPKQLLLYSALKLDPPQFAHVPFVLGQDRQKLSKRHGAQALAYYRQAGYHPDAMINYLSLLSWSSPSGDEYLSRERLVEEVSLDRIGMSDAIFDPDKLRWLSAKHISSMPIDQLSSKVSSFIDREEYPIHHRYLPAILDTVRTHLSAYSDINGQLGPFVARMDQEAVEKRDALRDDATAQQVLRCAHRQLANIESGEWEEETILGSIRETGKATGSKGRSLYEPLRTALTGRPHGPRVHTVCYVLGKEETLSKLEQAISPPGERHER